MTQQLLNFYFTLSHKQKQKKERKEERKRGRDIFYLRKTKQVSKKKKKKNKVPKEFVNINKKALIFILWNISQKING